MYRVLNLSNVSLKLYEDFLINFMGFPVLVIGARPVLSMGACLGMETRVLFRKEKNSAFCMNWKIKLGGLDKL